MCLRKQTRKTITMQGMFLNESVCQSMCPCKCVCVNEPSTTGNLESYMGVTLTISSCYPAVDEL